MKNKIALIIDSNEQYIHSKTKEILESWKYSLSSVKNLTKWEFGCANEVSLFDAPRPVLLNLNDKNNLKKFADLVKSKNKKFEDDWYGVGVIITATTSQGAKKIEELVEKSNGTILLKKQPEEVKSDLLKKIHIDTQIKNILNDYAGEDYSVLLNVVKTIEKMNIDEQRALTPQDVFIFLPRKAGSIPPWDFIESVLQCNLKQAKTQLKRTLINTHQLVILSLLTSKIELLYKYVVLKHNKDKNIDKTLNLKNKYQLISFNKMKNLPSVDVAEHIFNLVHQANNDLKGIAYIPNVEVYLQNLITRIILCIQYNKTI